MGSKAEPKADWAFGLIFFLLDCLTLLPFYNKGIQWFDEGTQLRMAQRALGENIGPLAPHGFPSFHWFYKILFSIFPFSLHTLRFEVLLVNSLAVGLFAVLGRFFFSRREMLWILLAYLPFQHAFGPFAYYSREANLCVLIASLLLVMGDFRPRSVHTGCAAFFLAMATGFKFNIGLLGFAAGFCMVWTWPFGFVGIFLLGLLVINASAQTALFSTLVSMPASYTKVAYIAMPAGVVFFFAVSVFAAWQGTFWMAQTPLRRRLIFLALLNLALLLQDFPRHWLAHLFWVPMPFWLLVPLLLRHHFRSEAILIMLFLIAGFWGMREFKPWLFLEGPWQQIPHENRLQILVKPQEEKILRTLKIQVDALCPKSSDAIFVFPVQPFLYFYLKRPNATSQDNFHGGFRWQDQVVDELTKHPPCAVISIPNDAPWGLRGDQEAPRIFQWIYKKNRLIQRVYAPGQFLFEVLGPHPL